MVENESYSLIREYEDNVFCLSSENESYSLIREYEDNVFCLSLDEDITFGGLRARVANDMATVLQIMVP